MLYSDGCSKRVLFDRKADMCMNTHPYKALVNLYSNVHLVSTGDALFI